GQTLVARPATRIRSNCGIGDHLCVADGVNTRESPYPFAEILERIEQEIIDRGLTVFARIDHRAGARGQGLDMQQATVLVFGNPRVGTPAMLAQPLAALDLPLRVLIWEQDGKTRVSYQEPAFVARRFGISEEIPAHAEALVDRALNK
ncbi:MAG: DUF302 domain-containing protein, partial [Solirubrobacteraceae bacterium]